ncbi:MAG: NHLP bacteriocin export ABC transporter permease/ATPase subunit [Desulfobacteraceae bacterium]|nr:NHLP bacteriocin export ABC transporter permease/ATPase subunit [Desulfobacteraceae bacterium]
MSSELKDIFAKEGKNFEISGNSPILLTGQDNVWYVLSGCVDLFAIQFKNGRISNPKDYFFSGKTGDLIFGMNLDDYGMGQGFQAVGHPGTWMIKLNLKRLKALGADPLYKKEIVFLVDRWVGGLIKGLIKNILPCPRPDILLDSGINLSVDGDKIAYSNKGNLWIRYVNNSGLFIGTEEFSNKDIFLPLSDKGWILMFKGSAIETFSTYDAMAAGLVWQSLEHFYCLIFKIIFLNTGLNSVDIYNFLSTKKEQDNRAKKDGIIHLSTVLDKNKNYNPCDEKFDDLLLSACSIVGKQLGISIKKPRQSNEKSIPRKITMDAIAKASHFNIRKVTLRPHWWQNDNGPLVGFMVENNRPITILPLSTSTNEIIDPSNDHRQKVTAKIAQGIAPHAYTFYRFLPDHALGGFDLLKFGMRGCARELKWILFLAVIIGLLSLITPLVTNLVFSQIIPNAEHNRILNIVGILAGFAITTALFELTRDISILRVENKLYYFMESAIWDRILRLPISFFKKYEAGDLAFRGMGVNTARQMISGPVITTMIGSIFSLFNFILLFYYNKNLALVATGLITLASLIIIFFIRLQLQYFRKQTRIEGKISGRLLQFLNAITKLRVSGSEDRVFSIWAKDFSKKKKISFKGGMIKTFLTTFNSVFGLFSLMAIFSWLILQEKGAGMETGEFLAFNAAFASLTAAVIQMVMSLNLFIMAVPYFERIRPILQHIPETSADKIDPGELSGKIELNHIGFRYAQDGPAVLKDISINVEPRSFVAIVGRSGSGKSTLIRLLLGFEKPESGTIYYDNQDLAELDVTQVRQNMGIVMQGGNVMAGDIFNNIIGSHPLTLDDAWEAASMAGLDEDIKQMPMGMNTVIMEGASTLSGGQRQRLIIARAIVNRPRILIFDEATSALDNKTQAIVSQSLKNLKTTRIIIAHRLSTIKDADQIYVMDNGQIKESGRYTELMKKNGLFAKIAQRQIF